MLERRNLSRRALMQTLAAMSVPLSLCLPVCVYVYPKICVPVYLCVDVRHAALLCAVQTVGPSVPGVIDLLQPGGDLLQVGHLPATHQ
jgi:hypothetical protein